MTLNYNVNGKARKELADVIEGILGTPKKYKGGIMAAYDIGGYMLEKDGALTGDYDTDLVRKLQQRGYTPTNMPELDDTYEQQTEPEPATESVDTEIPAIENGLDTPNEPTETEAPVTQAEPDARLTIEMPLDGFTPETLENLKKLVESKDVLIRKALGIEALPVEMTESTLRFPWFTSDIDGEHTAAYMQFITALCNTARKKKRVVAQPQTGFENEKFTMRVWLVGLGLIGGDYALCRKLMANGLSGDSAWRFGKGR